MGHRRHPDEHPDQKSSSEMPFVEKAKKLVDHWIHHNEDHAHNYKQWAQEFRQNELDAAASLLESVAGLTVQINHMLREAARQIPSSSS